MNKEISSGSWRNTLYKIIFEADTRDGKLFDVILIWNIVLSVIAVMLDSVSATRKEYGRSLYTVEWFFTILFTKETTTNACMLAGAWVVTVKFLVGPGLEYFISSLCCKVGNRQNIKRRSS